MDIQASPVCSLNSINSIPNVLLSHYDVQNKPVSEPTSEQLLYLISLEQADGMSQLVQVTKEQANALGICLYDSSDNNSLEIAESAKNKILMPIENGTVLNTNTVNMEIAHSTTKPLGSCENPIELIKDGEILHSTQNISADYLQQIARALHIETVEEDGIVENSLSEGDNEQVVYRVMFPHELCLRPAQTKRGRPKKGLKEDKNKKTENPVKTVQEPKVVQNQRTRFGRITRPPRHIKKDFSKIETSETDNNESDLKVVEFQPLKTNQTNTIESTPVEIVEPTLQKRKRLMPAQYRCPKCQKAYLGHTRMLDHIDKHPDHGPLPERAKIEENDTWNYLIDVSNTKPVGQRGIKFCQQLLTLLRNVQIVAKLLFRRSSGTERNLYFIDSLLSKILGIDSGNYIINESQLQWDVNILKFISDNVASNNNVDTDTEQTSTFDLHAYVEKNPLDNQPAQENKRFKKNEGVTLTENFSNSNVNCNLEKVKKNPCRTSLNFGKIQNTNTNEQITSIKLENINFHQELAFEQGIAANFSNEDQSKLVDPTMNVIASCNNVQSNLTNTNNEYSIQNDLLSDNSLLNSLPTLRTSVDDLICNVGSTQVTNLLDNSISSDELMNVDQFVNERFKNFTGSDIELPNPPLSLDLPTLDLFQFHSS